MTIVYVGNGRIRGQNFEIIVNDAVRSDKLNGFRLGDSVIEQLVDQDVEMIVFIDLNRGRYSISLEDWLEYRVWDDASQFQHVAQAKMSRG